MKNSTHQVVTRSITRRLRHIAQSPFLSLPAELRDMIYEETLNHYENPATIHSGDQQAVSHFFGMGRRGDVTASKVPYDGSLLLVNRQVSAEWQAVVSKERHTRSCLKLHAEISLLNPYRVSPYLPAPQYLSAPVNLPFQPPRYVQQYGPGRQLGPVQPQGLTRHEGAGRELFHIICFSKRIVLTLDCLESRTATLSFGLLKTVFEVSVFGILTPLDRLLLPRPSGLSRPIWDEFVVDVNLLTRPENFIESQAAEAWSSDIDMGDLKTQLFGLVRTLKVRMLYRGSGFEFKLFTGKEAPVQHEIARIEG